MDQVQIGDRLVGLGHPCLLIAEAGINHDGQVDKALALCRAAKAAGADYVKFQKRVPRLSVPPGQWNRLKQTPWGEVMPYIDYKERMELDGKAYDAIAAECRTLGLGWTASAWDVSSLDFLLAYAPPFLKVPSACLTDIELLEACRRSGRPVVASVGMSTVVQIARAVAALGPDRLVLLQCTSTYPAAATELNLFCIQTLRRQFRCPVGYSGHHPGIWDGFAAAVLGACLVEKHLTLDRSAIGTDHGASLEPAGLTRMVRYIRNWEAARGDGVKQVYDSELSVMAKLRRVL